MASNGNLFVHPTRIGRRLGAYDHGFIVLVPVLVPDDLLLILYDMQPAWRFRGYEPGGGKELPHTVYST